MLLLLMEVDAQNVGNIENVGNFVNLGLCFL